MLKLFSVYQYKFFKQQVMFFALKLDRIRITILLL